MVNKLSLDNASNNVKQSIKDVSKFYDDLKIAYPKDVQTSWLKDFINVLEIVKEILEVANFEINGNFNLGNELHLDSNYLNVIYSDIFKKYKNSFLLGGKHLYIEEISQRLQKLIEFFSEAKTSVTKFPDTLQLHEQGKQDLSKNLLKKNLIATYKNFVSNLLNHIPDRINTFILFLDRAQPIMMFDESNEVKETIKYLRGISEAIIKFRKKEKLSPRTHQWIWGIVGFLEKDIEFLSKMNVEICMPNEYDMIEFNTLVASKLEFSIVISEFQTNLNIFFKLALGFMVKKQGLIKCFQYDYIGRIFEKYDGIIKSLKPASALIKLKQLVQDHNKELDGFIELVWVQSEIFFPNNYLFIVKTSKMCYNAINSIRTLAAFGYNQNADLREQAESIIREIKPRILESIEIMQDFHYKYFMKELTRTLVTTIETASKCNTDFQLALEKHFNEIS